MDIRIRNAEGEGSGAHLLWDSVWDNRAGEADWALAGSMRGNAGGLQARGAIETAVVQCLFTDRRCPDEHPLRYLVEGDPRGWWGDGVDVRSDLGEDELGSLLWLLERLALRQDAALNIPLWAEALALEALQPLVRQGAAVRAEAKAVASPDQRRLDLDVALYGRDGQQIYARRFEALWNQIA